MERDVFRPFEQIVSALDAAIGHPDIKAFLLKAEAESPAGMRAMVEMALGPSAPVTILIVEEANSVRLSYDTMASLISPYGSARASQVARDLDKKVESLIIEIAH